MLDRRLDFTDVHAVSLVASREGPQNVLLLLHRVNRPLLRLPQRHQPIVGAIQGLVPGIVPSELILNLRVHRQRILLKNFHATPVIQLIFEGRVHL